MSFLKFWERYSADTKFHARHQVKVTLPTILALLAVFILIGVAYFVSFRSTTTELEQAISAASQAREAEPQDLAYCSGKGRLVQVVESESRTDVVCLNGLELVYIGFDRIKGVTTGLPAQRVGRDVVEASIDSTTYRLAEYGMSEIKNGVFEKSDAPQVSSYRDSPNLKRPGDLGISQKISYPKCDGKIVMISPPFVGTAAAKKDLPSFLSDHPSWEYLRTDLSCDNFYIPSKEDNQRDLMYVAYTTREYTEQNERELCNLIALPEYEGFVVDRLQDGVSPNGKLCG